MSKKGVKQSEEHIRKRLMAMHKNGIYKRLETSMKGNQFGKLLKGKKKPPRSAEHCQKLSEAMKGRHVSSGTEFKKGVKHSEEMIKKSAKSRIGLEKSSETCKKISESRKGEKHWNWKGGITPLRKKLYFSQKYKDWRKAVFERDNYACQCCEATGVELNAHHIKSWSLYPELWFDVDNGETLCIGCHRKTNSWGRCAQGVKAV